MSVENEKVPVKEKVGYALGDTASNLFWMSFVFFGSYFYTDVFGISAAAMGVMFFVARFFDAVNDPMMGMIADRTNTRWGKFRPYLIWMVVPFGISGTLAFTTPDWDQSNKLIYAYVTYILVGILYTAINIPYSALMGVISPNSKERTSVSTYRFVGAYTGGLIVNLTLLYLVKWLGQGSEQRGFMLTMGSFAVIAMVLFVVTFLSTKERVQPQQDQKTTAIRDIDDIVTNVPWLVLFLTGIFTLGFVSIRNGSVMYYFKYYVGDQSFLWMTSREGLVSAFFTIGALSTIAGTALIEPVTRHVSKKTLYIALMGINTVCVVTYFFLRPEQVAIMFVLQVLINFLGGPTAAIIFSMYADAADYAEWKRGRRSTGLVFSASSFAQKMGWTIGGTVSGILLSAFGYQANMEQAPEALSGIKLLMSLVPAVGAVLATVLVLFYRLDDKRMQEIERDLTARRTGEGAAFERRQGVPKPGSLPIFGSLSLLSGVAGLWVLFWYLEALGPGMTPDLRTMLYVTVGFGAALQILLMVGGVGLLQGRFWGRTLSIAFCLCGIILFLLSLPVQRLGEPTGLLGAAVALIYPVVLLGYLFSRKVAGFFDEQSLAVDG